MEIVSGRVGRPHVTSQQFRQIMEGIVGDGSCILPSGENLEPELVSNNSLKIRSGMMCHHGNVSSVKIGTYDEVELTNGSQGMKRIDLVVNRYTRNEEDNTEKNEWIVIMGTPAESNPTVPEYTKGNLQEGDFVDDCPAFEVHFDGINITEVTKMLEIAQTNKDLTEKLGFQMLLNTDEQQIYTMYGGQIKVVSGTKVVDIAMNIGYAALFSIEQLQELFGTDYTATRLSIKTYNGDDVAQEVHFYAPEVWNGVIFQYFYPTNREGKMRVNYRLEYVYG
ncbi:hypothetical protein [Dorea longicatena]|uniref:hypothetical protein n=1 Tax=Dorea longicatena TaxID=88431 RepID=UPI001FAB5296|nr:hypothetical protein [Dorea longicatena]